MVNASSFTAGDTLYPIDQYLRGQMSVETGITAHAGGTQAAGYQLTAAINSVDTVGSAADSVLLPLAAVGMQVVIANTTGTSMTVYGAGTDTINLVATATGVAQAANTKAVYYCSKVAPAGNWIRVLSA